jgi:hypothetical protein
VGRTMGCGRKLDREFFPYWTTCLIWSILGKRGEILFKNFQSYGIYKTAGKHVILIPYVNIQVKFRYLIFSFNFCGSQDTELEKNGTREEK